MILCFFATPIRRNGQNANRKVEYGFMIHIRFSTPPRRNGQNSNRKVEYGFIKNMFLRPLLNETAKRDIISWAYFYETVCFPLLNETARRTVIKLSPCWWNINISMFPRQKSSKGAPPWSPPKSNRLRYTRDLLFLNPISQPQTNRSSYMWAWEIVS